MAAAVSASNACLRHFTAPAIPIPKKPNRVICFTPRKFAIRKNFLRQKLYKTLTKPCPDSPFLEIIPADPLTPIEHQPRVDRFEEELEVREFRESEIKESASTSDGFVGNVSKVSIFNHGLWFCGVAAVFSMILEVLRFGSFQFEDKERKNGVLEAGLNGRSESRVKFLRNDKLGLEYGGLASVGDGEKEKLMEEIRMMAREARESERLEGKKHGYESGDSDTEAEVEFGNSGIEKEVFDGLVKRLRKKLENDRRNLPVESVNNVEKDHVSGKTNVGGEESDALMFRKKYRFRGFSSRPSDKPKGFTGVNEDRISKDGGSEVLMNGDVKPDGIVDLPDNVLNNKVPDADWEENGSWKQDPEATESSRTAAMKSTDVPNERDELKKATNLKSIGIEDNQSPSKIANEKPESETEPWWSNLPYVLVIMMHGELDGPITGLFTLKDSSYAKSDLSYTVAFEDRGDATNFCYLVQSFFEDLEGFSAEVVPLPIKELSERVKSQTLKVIVVKKRQLKLFAGQPLEDAEMALRSLIR